MFERFTERARDTIVFAQEESRLLKHNYIGAEHILLGLVAGEDSVAARVLSDLGVTIADARSLVERIVGKGDEAVTGQIPFTPRAKKIQELALREALSLGHNYIGTEHLLLGLVRSGQEDLNAGTVDEVMRSFNIDAAMVREKVMARLMPRREVVATERSVTSFELADSDQEIVDGTFAQIMSLTVKQWLALKTKLDDIDPPGGRFLYSPEKM